MTTNNFHQTKVKIIHFFNKIKTIYNKTKIDIKQLIINLITSHQLMRLIIKQMFLHHIHRNTICDNLDQIEHLKIIFFIHKTQLVHNLTNHCKCKTQLVHNLINQCRCKTLSVYIFINQRKCKIKSHYHITYSSLK